MAPAGLSNGVVDSLVKASPQVLYLLFGRRVILSSATMWETLVYPPLFSRVIDMGLSFLFKWRTKNISASQKLAAYPHLYSFTSTKSVVHWFQIIRNKCFQMYDDDVHQPMSLSTTNKYSKVAKYPTRNIKTPVVLVYGGSDSLVDISTMLRELPRQTVATEIPHYEHLDFLWARDVDTQVFQHVFDALDSFTDAEHTKEEYDHYHMARHESLIGSGSQFVHLHRGSESEASVAAGNGDSTQQSQQQHLASEQRHRKPAIVSGAVSAVVDDDAYPSSPEPFPTTNGFFVPNVDSAYGSDSTGKSPDGKGGGASSGVINLDSIYEGEQLGTAASKAADLAEGQALSTAEEGKLGTVQKRK
jgi:lysosomal acid lipase/cholesteryl ester hydrolase